MTESEEVKIRKRRSSQEIKRVVTEFETSGLRQCEFCYKHGLESNCKPRGLRTSSWDFARDWRFPQRNNTPCDVYVAHSRSPPDRIPGRLCGADNHSINRNIDRCSAWATQSGSGTSRDAVIYWGRNIFSTTRVSRRYRHDRAEFRRHRPFEAWNTVRFIKAVIWIPLSGKLRAKAAFQLKAGNLLSMTFSFERSEQKKP